MAARTPAPEPTEKPAKAAVSDGGAAELQKITDAALEQGFFGTTADPFPNSAYSLASGPASPSAADLTKKEKADG